MMKETDEMRDARHALERLSASDPVAQANMLRFVAAVTIMLTGRRSGGGGDELLVGAGFRLMGDAEQLPAAVTRRDGADRVFIAFDVDDAAGPPAGLGLFRKEGDALFCYGLCRLWSPAGEGRAVLVPNDDGSLGYFAYKSGSRCRRVDGLPAGDLEAGYRRAATRLARLCNSEELRNQGGSGYLQLMRTESGRMFTESTKIAA